MEESMKTEKEEKPRVFEDQEDPASNLGATAEAEAYEAEPLPAEDLSSRTPPWMKTSTVNYDEDRQSRSTAADPSPAVKKARERLKAQARRGPQRPLAILAEKERELRTHSAALATLSSSKHERPDKNLLVHQLVNAVDTSGTAGWRADQLKKEAVALHAALPSEDATDSLLNRLIVASACSAMACHARAARTYNPRAVETSLRYAEKLSRVTINLVEARENRRGPRKVTVGNVKVEAGGQAIVGNVENQNQRRSENDTNDEAIGASKRSRRRKR
jgi:hypothetical protein